jgi:hypothetical protein
MKSTQLTVSAIGIITILSTDISAQTEVTISRINPFTHITDNALKSFSGYNILLQTGGVAATYFIVNTDIDRRVHNYFYNNINTYNEPSVPAVYIGYFGPIVLGGGLYLAGIKTNNIKNACAGSAVLQSAFLAFIESSMLKAFTGRQHPDSWVYDKESDKSRNFRFGFMRNGIHYGWPSGHMSATTAVVSSLTAFYLDNRVIRYSAWATWAYMFLGVTVHEGNTMHWFSDIITGSMIGYAIGNSVGQNFRRFYEGENNDMKTHILISPLINYSCMGLQMNVNF